MSAGGCRVRIGRSKGSGAKISGPFPSLHRKSPICLQAARNPNPKSEIRNPKQIQTGRKREAQNQRATWFLTLLLWISDLLRISDSELRILETLRLGGNRDEEGGGFRNGGKIIYRRDFRFGRGVEPGRFEKADGQRGFVGRAPNNCSAFQLGRRIAAGIPIAHVIAVNDRNSLFLAIGIMNHITAQERAVARMPSGRVQEVKLTARLEHRDANDLLRVRAAAPLLQFQTGKLHDATDIKQRAA